MQNLARVMVSAAGVRSVLTAFGLMNVGLYFAEADRVCLEKRIRIDLVYLGR